MAESSASESSSETDEDDFRATTQDLLAGLEESKILVKRKPLEIRRREGINLDELKFSIFDNGVLEDLPEPNTLSSDERVAVVGPHPGAWSPQTPSSPKDSESVVTLHSVSTPNNFEILDLTTLGVKNLSHDLLSLALVAHLPRDASASSDGLLIDVPAPSYCDSPEIPSDESLNVSCVSTSQNLDTHSSIETSIDSRGLKNRSRVFVPKEWKKNKAKSNRLKGEAYTGYRRLHPGSTKKIVQDVPKDGRSMGPTCSSSLCAKWQNRLCNTVSEEERKAVFYTFWNDMSSWDMKRMYICGSVEIIKSKRSRVEDRASRRNLSYFYFLRIKGERIPVCQKMFMDTHGITKTELRYWLEHFHQSNVPNARTNNASPAERTPENDSFESNNDVLGRKDTGLISRREIVDVFFDDLPVVHFKDFFEFAFCLVQFFS
ncbi:hypothetical protein GE061_016827 [Apolygus lucorum]|uniref:Uncharacterized protein n=1 Tax=Apolygus lucorum TaxID=248454 RepID=A0A8S9XHA6_APOLU|nr:hypothetical protein GE061_016827 [Apolygus lucorum]